MSYSADYEITVTNAIRDLHARVGMIINLQVRTCSGTKLIKHKVTKSDLKLAEIYGRQS